MWLVNQKSGTRFTFRCLVCRQLLQTSEALEIIYLADARGFLHLNCFVGSAEAPEAQESARVSQESPASTPVECQSPTALNDFTDLFNETASLSDESHLEIRKTLTLEKLALLTAFERKRDCRI